MKRGGQVIYAGPLGRQSHKLVEYFEVSFPLVLILYTSFISDFNALWTNIYNQLQAVPGVTKIKDGYNPATWMLEVTAPAVEAQLDVDFADIYANSSLYQ